MGHKDIISNGVFTQNAQPISVGLIVGSYTFIMCLNAPNSHRVSHFHTTLHGAKLRFERWGVTLTAPHLPKFQI